MSLVQTDSVIGISWHRSPHSLSVSHHVASNWPRSTGFQSSPARLQARQPILLGPGFTHTKLLSTTDLDKPLPTVLPQPQHTSYTNQPNHIQLKMPRQRSAGRAPARPTVPSRAPANPTHQQQNRPATTHAPAHAAAPTAGAPPAGMQAPVASGGGGMLGNIASTAAYVSPSFPPFHPVILISHPAVSQ